MALDARVASKIRIVGVVVALNTATDPRVTLVAMIVNVWPGRAAARSANVHFDAPGSHVSMTDPKNVTIASPEFTPQVFM
jgi:hypothetical protein